MTKPKRTFLRKVINELERHVNFREGWENHHSETNGEYRLLNKVIPQADFILDVGANIGDWSAHCLNINPQARIIAFEASPETARTFQEKHLGNDHVTLLNYGLGDIEGFFEFYDYGPNAGMSGFFSREESVGKKPEKIIKVEKKRLDSVKELEAIDRIDFVKIDTEGAEINVMKGASGLLENKKIKLLQFEYGGTWIDARQFLVDAFELLTKHGYIIGRVCPKEIWWLEGYHSDLEKFRYANFIACSSKKDAKDFGIA